jgi:hypothetical protein
MNIVQNVVVQVNPASGGTIALPLPVTAGNHQILDIIQSGSGVTFTLTDSLGNAFTRRITDQVIGSSVLSSWIIPVAADGASTITVSYNLGLARRVYLREVNDLDASVLPIVVGNPTNTANPVTSGSVSPTRNNAYICSYFFHAGGAALTPGAGFTERHDSVGQFLQDTIQATAGAINPEATASSAPSSVGGLTVAWTGNAAPTDALVVDDEPSNAWTGEVIRPPVVVNLTDGVSLKPSATDTVTAAIASGAGTLSGTVSVAAVGGVATFANLIVSGAGLHTLSFTSPGYAAATSASFKVATGSGVPGGGSTVISRGSDMQTIVKNSTDQDELTVIVDAIDASGNPIDIGASLGASTLQVGGSSLAETPFTGTVIRRGSSATHLCVFTQAQANAFAVEEKGYIRIPAATGAVPISERFLVTERAVGDAPLTEQEISDAVNRDAIAYAKTLKRTGADGNGGFEITGPDGAETGTLATEPAAAPVVEWDTAS